MLFKASLKALILSATVLLPTALMAQDAPAEAPATEAPAETAAPAPVAAETAAPAEAPAAGDKETIAVENPYGIGALWAQGDFVAKGVLVLMLIMSGATWYIMIVKLIDQTKLFKQAKEANATFWTSKSVAEGLSKVKTGTPFWYIADRGVAASQHHEGTLVEQIDLSSWVTMSINRAVDEIQSKLQGGLAVLATVGSTAPFVGLFGTVWGIYHALTAIGISGQASIDKVAGPVGEALIMTAIGLAVAVPAVMGYNWLVRRNKAGMETVRSFSADLHSVLLSGTRVGNK
ncbi:MULTISPECIES: MotA/TolQ/ExbB proton channel family protein [Hydrocarboniphaga]|uniref:Biopolymer transport protein ExbB n=1 Tax=Hydrocarboniphaga effusa AP103 TaxID=1172194 RepID=I8T499_9GAMM|nr:MULTISPECIES: MotA/TolQ/ExbB proton channel family protein [Hydrocarboniphaga]EIT68765.1 MotA/TolQ/ExbB proton channel family protein [Hydrocarboniphaga effusa AP103]MDZ4076893.1 MotA/TolQ/ExbB proton channel family protein [Hydrocarboniphaga sp.]